MALDNPVEMNKADDSNRYADLGGILDHSRPQPKGTLVADASTATADPKESKGVPCVSGDTPLSAQQLQDEINVTMASRGYVFKNPEVGGRTQEELGKRGIPYNPNPSFNEETDLTPEDKERVAGIQNQKMLLNYPGDACTDITDGQHRQHGAKELLPDSSSKVVGTDELKQLATDGSVSSDQLRLARNEIFMRAGRPFASKDLREFAEQQGYRPRTSYSDNDLTAAEVQNARVMLGVETYMKGQGIQRIDIPTLDQVVGKLK